MLVKVFNSLDSFDSFELETNNIKQILNYIKNEKGKEYTDNIIHNKFNYVIANTEGTNEPLMLLPEVILSDIKGYDVLFIIPDIEGEDPISATMVAAVLFAECTVVGMQIAAVIAFVANMAIMMAVSFAVSSIMSLLSPTPEFSSDPSMAQEKQSNLFNGAPLIREQGGSVPLIFGNPFCGGVLISSGMYSEDVI
jgi:predicted phage tail protein